MLPARLDTRPAAAQARERAARAAALPSPEDDDRGDLQALRAMLGHRAAADAALVRGGAMVTAAEHARLAEKARHRWRTAVVRVDLGDALAEGVFLATESYKEVFAWVQGLLQPVADDQGRLWTPNFELVVPPNKPIRYIEGTAAPSTTPAPAPLVPWLCTGQWAATSAWDGPQADPRPRYASLLSLGLVPRAALLLRPLPGWMPRAASYGAHSDSGCVPAVPAQAYTEQLQRLLATGTQPDDLYRAPAPAALSVAGQEMRHSPAQPAPASTAAGRGGPRGGVASAPSAPLPLRTGLVPGPYAPAREPQLTSAATDASASASTSTSASASGDASGDAAGAGAGAGKQAKKPKTAEEELEARMLRMMGFD
jgi:hypothetical protein